MRTARRAIVESARRDCPTYTPFLGQSFTHMTGNHESEEGHLDVPEVALGFGFRIRRNQPLDESMYASKGQPCFFTVRSYLRTIPFADPRVADSTVQRLLDQRTKSCCEVETFCLMPDHLHVIVTCAEDGDSTRTFMQRFKGAAARGAHQMGWRGQLWQPRWYDRLLLDWRDDQLRSIADYIMQNPVRRGLSSHANKYPWSGDPVAIFDL
jgi:REP element-mobilizing transposase RayT